MKINFPNEIVEQWKIVGPVMTALGSLTRQRIIMLFEPGEKLNVKAIADQFNLSRTAVVHHIGVLQDSGLLKSQKVGKEVMLEVDWKLLLVTLDKIKAYVNTYKHS